MRPVRHAAVPTRRTYASLLATIGALSCASSPTVVPNPAEAMLVRNADALLSEDPDRDEALERSVAAFLAQARTGDFTQDVVDLDEIDRYRVFYRRVSRFGDTPGLDTPLLLKTYTLNERDYFVTIAFTGESDGTPFIDMIVELKATPHGDGYRFHCPFEERTKDFHTTTLDDVRFRYSGDFDEARAREFMTTRAELARITGRDPEPLEYFAFQSLDEMLKAYGLVFDEARCNFLGHDLGHFDDERRRYVTGMGDECYMYGYSSLFLLDPRYDIADRNVTMHVGFRTLFGGYWLVGTPMPLLKEELRETLRRNPELDLVDVFKKGRNGQTLGHAPSLVMAALLCEETLERGDFDDVLRLVYSGRDGERLFAELQAILGIDEAGFRDAIVAMLDEEPNDAAAALPHDRF